MRFVNSLKEITLCPNCGADTLLCIQHYADMTQSKFCPNCREEIFESAQTIDDKAQEKKEMEFFDLREDIEGLRYHIKTIHDEHLITHLQVILNKMTDIIERKEQ
jgi:DNA replicative helicase MCM subunit Mcm2 (Cdc46/Mcm family)